MDVEQHTLTEAEAEQARIVARNALVEANLPLAMLIARKLWTSAVVRRLGTRNDVRQQCLLGLMRAVEHFDTTRGAFSTYAFAVIRRHVFDAAGQAGPVTVPATTAWMARTREPLTQQKAKTRTRAQQALAPTQGLGLLAEDLPEPEGQGETLRFVEEMLARLPAASRKLLCRRFGLHGEEPHSLDTLAVEEGLTKQGVDQRLQSIYRHLRAHHDN